MSERETVKEEVTRLKRELSDLEWCAFGAFGLASKTTHSISERIRRRIDYLTREYIARGIIYEPEH